jgi:GMP synthase-like glutamine amidotransferase
MKIGILNSDTVQIDGASGFGQYPEMFSKIFWSVDPNIQFKTYEIQFGDYPRDLNECDAYLITGSKASSYDDYQWIQDLKKFIQVLDQNKKKLIGICFGHQIIAEALGGSVRNSPNGWHAGVDSISFNNNVYDYGEEGKKYNLVFSHQDEVQKLPDNATLIAGSATCPNGMFLIENHIFCTQGHIELDKRFARIIYDFRKNQIGDLKHNHACETLTIKTDEFEIVKILLEFLKK